MKNEWTPPADRAWYEGTYTFTASSLNLAHTHWTVAQFLLDPAEDQLEKYVRLLVERRRLSEHPTSGRNGLTALHDAAAGVYSLGVSALGGQDDADPTPVRFPRYVLTRGKQRRIAQVAAARRRDPSSIPEVLSLTASVLQLRDLTSCSNPEDQRSVGDGWVRGASDQSGSLESARKVLSNVVESAFAATGEPPIEAVALAKAIIDLNPQSGVTFYNLACFASRQADFLARSSGPRSDQGRIDADALGLLGHALQISAPDLRRSLTASARCDGVFQYLRQRESKKFDDIAPPEPKPSVEQSEPSEPSEPRALGVKDLINQWAIPDADVRIHVNGLLQRIQEVMVGTEVVGAAARHAALVRAEASLVDPLRDWWERLPVDAAYRGRVLDNASRALFLSPSQVRRLVEHGAT